MATSVVRRANPNVTARTRYITRKRPPPSFAARYGNLQMFPSPTALPAAARTNPKDVENVFLFFELMIADSSTKPSCASARRFYKKKQNQFVFFMAVSMSLYWLPYF